MTTHRTHLVWRNAHLSTAYSNSIVYRGKVAGWTDDLQGSDWRSVYFCIPESDPSSREIATFVLTHPGVK